MCSTAWTVCLAVQALVDDDLVHSDKIGISNFFWSFPSEAAVKLKNDLEKYEKQLHDSKRQLTSLQAQVEQSRAEKAFSVCQPCRRCMYASASEVITTETRCNQMHLMMSWFKQSHVHASAESNAVELCDIRMIGQQSSAA